MQDDQGVCFCKKAEKSALITGKAHSTPSHWQEHHSPATGKFAYQFC